MLIFGFASLQLLKSLTFKQGAADFLRDRHEWHLRYVISTANILFGVNGPVGCLWNQQCTCKQSETDGNRNRLVPWHSQKQ